MTRMICLLMVCSGLAACATGSGARHSLASSVFDHPPAHDERASVHGFGYRLAGADGWSADLTYESGPGAPGVAMQYDLGDGGGDSADLAIAMPYLSDGLRRFHGITAGGEPVDIEMQAGPCRTADGATWQYFVTADLAGRQLTGCGAEVAEQDRWSNYLPDYLPAIDTCLAEFRAPPVHVSLAYTLAGGEIGVRIVDGETQTWECATRDNGTAINSLRVVGAADAMFGEGDPIFVRGVYPEFGEGCYVYETVREADGTLIGSFGHDACDAAPVAAAGREVG